MLSRHGLSWAGSRLLAGLSDQLILFAIPILVYRKTGSLSASGAAYFIEWLPRIVSPLIGGVLVDFFCSKKVAVLSDAIRCVFCLIAFLIVLLAPGAPFWIYALIAGAIGLLWETSFLAFDVSISRTSQDPANLPKIQSAIQGTEQLALIIGPGLALGIVTVLNLPALFLVSAVLFFIASLVASLTRKPDREAQSASLNRAVALIAEGYGIVLKNPVLRGLVLLCFAQNVAVGLSLALSPGFLQEGLGAQESAFAMLTLVSGLVSLVLFLALPTIVDGVGLSLVGRVATFLSPIALLIMGSSSHYVQYFIGFSLLVAVDGALSIVLRTYRVLLVPSERLGSVVAAIIFILNLGFPLGGALLAVLVPVLGGKWVLLSAALTGALVLVGTLPALRSSFSIPIPRKESA